MSLLKAGIKMKFYGVVVKECFTAISKQSDVDFTLSQIKHDPLGLSEAQIGSQLEQLNHNAEKGK